MAKSLTVRDPTKKSLTVESQTTEILFKKVSGGNVWIKNYVTKCLRAQKSKLKSPTATVLILKIRSKSLTLRSLTSTFW